MFLIIPFIVAFLIVALITPITIKYAGKFGLVDNPKTHKHPAIIHKKTLPRAGGLPIYIGILVAILFFFWGNTFFIPILFAGALVVVIGLLDDKYDVSAYVRFIGNIFCAALVVIFGVSIPFITNPLGGILSFT